MTTTEALKPCPFCGGRARIIEAEPAGYVAECLGCQASSALVYALGDEPNVAERWNRRAAIPTRTDGRESARLVERLEAETSRAEERGYQRRQAEILAALKEAGGELLLRQAAGAVTMHNPRAEAAEAENKWLRAALGTVRFRLEAHGALTSGEDLTWVSAALSQGASHDK